MEKLPLPSRFARPLGYPRVAALPEGVQKSLRAFWLDGLFASLSTAFTDSYYTLYILSLGATNAQIGLVSMLNQLAGAGMSLPGAAIADRTGRYKLLSWISGILSRLMWPLMIIAPWVFPDSRAVWVIVIAWVGISVFGALGSAAWTALTADLVPNDMRGGYFASRNIVMQLVRLATIPLAGVLIDQVGEPGGYQVNLAIAFVIGLFAVYFFYQLPEHPAPESTEAEHVSIRAELRKHTVFLRFTLTHSLLHFGVMIGGPFITVYMIQAVEFDVATIGMATTVSVFSGMIGMRLFGKLHDRLGMIQTMYFGLAAPVLPVLWLWVQAPWQAFLVQSLAGLTWAGYNLGAFNLLLASTPNEHRPRYVALHSTVIAIVGALAPIIGGWLLDAAGFLPVFSLSTIMRSVAFILFIVLVREPAMAALKPHQRGRGLLHLFKRRRI